jgi:hypothetical protein
MASICVTLTPHVFWQIAPFLKSGFPTVHTVLSKELAFYS